MTDPHPQTKSELSDPLCPPIPQNREERRHWGRLYGMSDALAIASAVERFPGLVLAIADDVQHAEELERELHFFLGDDGDRVLALPDWETLPYDIFSPLPELISQRLLTLHRLGSLKKGVLIVPVSTLLQRLAPRSYLDAHSFVLARGEELSLEEMRSQLERAGYQRVSQVMAHG